MLSKENELIIVQRSGHSSDAMADLSQYNGEQVKMMEERVILVDPNDVVIGHESKKNSAPSLLLALALRLSPAPHPP